MPHPQDLDRAHRHSSCHRAEIEASEVCGCFFCLATFPPTEIQEWVDNVGAGEDAPGITALCPRCGIDSVIGSASGYPITPEFLGRMEVRWFNMRHDKPPA